MSLGKSRCVWISWASILEHLSIGLDACIWTQMVQMILDLDNLYVLLQRTFFLSKCFRLYISLLLLLQQITAIIVA